MPGFRVDRRYNPGGARPQTTVIQLIRSLRILGGCLPVGGQGGFVGVDILIVLGLADRILFIELPVSLQVAFRQTELGLLSSQSGFRIDFLMSELLRLTL